MPDMLRTKVTSCLKPRLLSGSARCYKCRRAHGALTKELSEGGTESMTERDHRTGSGGGKDNVRDELDEAAGSRKEAAPEEEEQAGSGRVKDTVRVRKLSGGERGAKERNRVNAQTTDNGRHHQQSPLQTEGGTTTIQDSVVCQVAGMAAQEVEGIRMGSSTTQAVGSIMSAVPGVGSQSESRGVSVDV